MRNLRESNIDGPSYGFNNRLASEDPVNLPEIISRVSAGRLSRLRLVERPGHLSPGQLCPIAIAQGVLLDAVVTILVSINSFSTIHVSIRGFGMVPRGPTTYRYVIDSAELNSI